MNLAPKNEKIDFILVSTSPYLEILAAPWKRKLSEFSSEPFHRRKK
jgi:hypothetical protein